MKLLNFSYFKENFTGLRLTTKRCFSCETDVNISEEIIDLLISLPKESELNDKFIQVISHFFQIICNFGYLIHFLNPFY